MTITMIIPAGGQKDDFDSYKVDAVHIQYFFNIYDNIKSYIIYYHIYIYRYLFVEYKRNVYIYIYTYIYIHIYIHIYTYTYNINCI